MVGLQCGTPAGTWRPMLKPMQLKALAVATSILHTPLESSSSHSATVSLRVHGVVVSITTASLPLFARTVPMHSRPRRVS